MPDIRIANDVRLENGVVCRVAWICAKCGEIVMCSTYLAEVALFPCKHHSPKSLRQKLDQTLREALK